MYSCWPSRSNRARISGPRARSKGRSGFLADASRGVRLPLALGEAAQVLKLQRQSDTGGDDLRGIPLSATSVVRSTSCRRTTSLRAPDQEP